MATAAKVDTPEFESLLNTGDGAEDTVEQGKDSPK